MSSSLSQNSRIVGMSFLLLLELYWSYQLLFTSSHWAFITWANLLIHESGHLFFSIFGQFLSVLGGSLFQLLIPTAILWYFWSRRQLISAAFSLFWLGSNLIYVGIYISDARTQSLPLVNEGSLHDWHWLLTMLNLLNFDKFLGNTTFVIGVIIITISLIWTASQITKNYRNN